MYISGLYGDLEKRMHQLTTSYSDLQTGYIPEARGYLATGSSNLSGLSGVWEKEIEKKELIISGSGDGRNVL